MRFLREVAAWSTAGLAALAAVDSHLGNMITVPWPLLAADAALGAALLLFRDRLGRRPWTRWALAVLPAVSTASIGPAALAVARAAARRRWRTVLPLGAVFASALAAGFHAPWTVLSPVSPAWAGLLLVAVSVTSLVTASAYRGARVDLIGALRERALDAEREQHARVAAARFEERNRIAREMHDVLAHRLTIISLDASALSYRPDLPEADRRSLAEEILSNTRQSLAEVRGILADLRSSDGPTDDAPDAPQPTFEELGRLFEDNRRAGVELDVRDEVSALGPAPSGTGRHAYRIVQEALTNARKHGAPGPVTVRVLPDGEDAVLIEVRNPVAAGPARPGADGPGGGVGLVGLTERVAICGGSLVWGDAGDHFELRARLPWTG